MNTGFSDVNSIGDEFSVGLLLGVFRPQILGEAPLLAGDDSLSSGEFIFGSS